jgi:hypothetical protein
MSQKIANKAEAMEKKRLEEVIEWLDESAEPMPLVALDSSPGEQRVLGWLQRYPILVDEPLEAMLWVRLGMIDRAHEIVQDATNGIRAYIHGIIHRLEGDFWNANYWFRQVRSPELISRIAETVGAGLDDKPFEPARFTDAVEAWRNASSATDVSRLQEIAQREWQAIWDELTR